MINQHEIETRNAIWWDNIRKSMVSRFGEAATATSGNLVDRKSIQGSASIADGFRLTTLGMKRETATVLESCIETLDEALSTHTYPNLFARMIRSPENVQAFLEEPSTPPDMPNPVSDKQLKIEEAHGEFEYRREKGVALLLLSRDSASDEFRQSAERAIEYIRRKAEGDRVRSLVTIDHTLMLAHSYSDLFDLVGSLRIRGSALWSRKSSENDQTICLSKLAKSLYSQSEMTPALLAQLDHWYSRSRVWYDYGELIWFERLGWAITRQRVMNTTPNIDDILWHLSGRPNY